MDTTTTDRTEARRRDGFRAMGTDVSLYGPDGEAFDEAFAAIRRVFETEERRFSRFRDDSELTAVNRLAGRWVPVSSPFERVVRLALDHASATGGLFDPTVLHALMAAGYDRDFDEVLAGARGALHPPEPCGRWTEVQVRQGAVRLPPEVGLDLGGIAKGWTVDLAAAGALDAGLAWALVAAGGDLAIVGDAPLLEIPIEDPETLERPMATLRLDRGALATSSVAKRSWGPRPSSRDRSPNGCAVAVGHRAGHRLGADVRRSRGAGHLGVVAWARRRRPAVLRHRRLQRRRHRELRPGGGPMTNWNLLRAAGIGAYLMLYLAVAWGLVATTSIISKRISKASSNLFHQFVATTGLVLLGVHLALLLIDGFMPFAPLDLILPMRSTYRPIPITLGIAAMFAMVGDHGARRGCASRSACGCGGRSIWRPCPPSPWRWDTGCSRARTRTGRGWPPCTRSPASRSCSSRSCGASPTATVHPGRSALSRPGGSPRRILSPLRPAEREGDPLRVPARHPSRNPGD